MPIPATLTSLPTNCPRKALRLGRRFPKVLPLRPLRSRLPCRLLPPLRQPNLRSPACSDRPRRLDRFHQPRNQHPILRLKPQKGLRLPQSSLPCYDAISRLNRCPRERRRNRRFRPPRLCRRRFRLPRHLSASNRRNRSPLRRVRLHHRRRQHRQSPPLRLRACSRTAPGKNKKPRSHLHLSHPHRLQRSHTRAAPSRLCLTAERCARRCARKRALHRPSRRPRPRSRTKEARLRISSRTALWRRKRVRRLRQRHLLRQKQTPGDRSPVSLAVEL